MELGVQILGVISGILLYDYCKKKTLEKSIGRRTFVTVNNPPWAPINLGTVEPILTKTYRERE